MIINRFYFVNFGPIIRPLPAPHNATVTATLVFWIIFQRPRAGCEIGIAAALLDHESFYFEQIRERRRVLRIYWGGRLSPATEAAVREAIDLAEARSQCVCGLCSGGGRLYQCAGVLMTRCGGHAQGSPVPVRRGFEDVHLTQKVVKDSIRVVVSRRYDPELDSFVELDPADLKEGT
jgi:hypothetical protein